MAVPRLKRNRSAERRKIELAEKYREQGKETGGGRISIKKIRRKLEARNLPIAKAKQSTAGKKQRTGRTKTPARAAAGKR